ncbi:MAG TPA: hypothetical protein PLF42_09760, partial [Anaerolineales bacterium]|nr:hypothetical protein [Anaerolineales bacterium]
MQRPPEEHIKLARGAYNWLRISPILTIPTLLIIVGMDLAFNICRSYYNVCYLQSGETINYTLGVLGSALWHLILLQYVNNKDGFVRRHGQQALIYAGVRTGIALGGVALDYFAGAGFGGGACIAILILVLLWFALPALGMSNIKREIGIEEEAPAVPSAASYIPGNSVEVEMSEMDDNENKAMPLETASDKPEEILKEILGALKSVDPEKKISAMARLRTLTFSSEAIRSELEILALKGGNAEVRRSALAALDLPANRNVQKRINSNKVDRGTRYVLLREIEEWVKANLLDRQNAELIRRRYDFDFESASQPFDSAQGKPAPTPAPAPAPTPQVG